MTQFSDEDDEGGRVTSEVGPLAIVPVWVLTKKLTPAELVTYVALRSFADRARGAYPRTETIAKRANLAVGTVRNAVQSLRKKGLISTTPRYRADKSLAGLDYRMFDIDPDPIEEAEPRRAGAKGGPKPGSSRGTPTDVPPSTGGKNTPAGYTTDVPPRTPTDVGVDISWCTQEQTNEQTKKEQTKPLKTPADAGGENSNVAQVPAQTTIDGSEERLNPKNAPTEETPEQRAFGIARGWVEYRKSPKVNKPIGASNPLHAVKDLVIVYIKAGYTDDEVKRALNGLAEGLPSKLMMQRALDTIRDRKPIGASGRPDTRGAGARVNDHWDQVEAEGNPVGGREAAPKAAAIQTTGAFW